VSKDEVDAAVGTPAFGPLVPKPNLIDLGRSCGVVLEKPFDNPLKLLAPLVRARAETVEEGGERSWHFGTW